MPDTQDLIKQVHHYHQETKHNFNRYARSLGYLDWANQPNPFRRYQGAPLVKLPLLRLDEPPLSPSYDALYESILPPQPLTLKTLSRFFEYALSITAWKAYGGTRWALRSNPSSGNLHPTEGYCILGTYPALPLEPGLYHYAPKEHGLEYRCQYAPDAVHELLAPFPPDTFLVGLSSIHWREAWKYGERAFRYCQHDIGHALGTLRIAAATLGWRLIVLTGVDDHTIGTLLGIQRDQDFLQTEPEFPELLAAVLTIQPESEVSIPLTVDSCHVQQCSEGSWHGTANRLSRDNPVPWEIIDEVTAASWKHSRETDALTLFPFNSACTTSPKEESSPSLLAGAIIHQRRSAVAFDGKTSIPLARFYAMLSRIMPHSERPVSQRPVPWDAVPWDPTIHLGVFVHRVDGLSPGLYLLIRHHDPAMRQVFQQAMHAHFSWITPPGCPSELPFYLLEEGHAQQLAMQLSCWQDIAGDSAFSLGMIAEFDASLNRYGPWFYRRLFWEAGLIGQVLYLEAEAAGVRATGIGCFFDDPVHRVFGFYPSTQFQSLYHFTVGGPIEDRRLTTLPPYEGTSL
ncbi:MAG: SagB/ThcOx family dehydrogenase [Nitrospirae bacterium]|nr:MAG: SagB/ThcOx family dehydrogenase [Nitrospirota bacterium]